jgi:hypothetical protein
LVIILSILAAFAIDAWWDDRQENERERALLSGILQDLRDSENDLELKTMLSESLLQRQDDVLSRLVEQPEGATIFVSVYQIGSLVSVPTYDANTTILDAAVSSGELELIRSRRIKNALSAWQRAYRDNREDEEAIRDLTHVQLLPVLSEAARIGDVFDRITTQGSPPELDDSPAREMTVDRRLEGLMGLRLFYQQFVAESMRDLTERQHELIELIEAELGS